MPLVLWNGEARVTSPRRDGYESAFSVALADAQRHLAAGVNPADLYPTLTRESTARHRARIEPLASRQHIDSSTAPSLGRADAPVTIVLFSDFECPFCNRQVDVLLQLQAAFPDRVRVAFRQFPVGFHPHARLAAEAAVCAARQGKLWPYVDALRSHGMRLQHADLIDYARAAGLDVARFTRDLDGKVGATEVDTDLALGKLVGVSATPTLFVNGLRFVGLQGIAELRRVVESETRPGWLEELTP